MKKTEHAPRKAAEPFTVYNYDGTKLGNTDDFSTAMTLHIQALHKDIKRPELYDLYAGVSEFPSSYGQPLFYLSRGKP